MTLGDFIDALPKDPEDRDVIHADWVDATLGVQLSDCALWAAIHTVQLHTDDNGRHAILVRRKTIDESQT